MKSLYEVEGRLYRAEPIARATCVGCAFFDRPELGEACIAFANAAQCADRDTIAKAIPPGLPVPASVNVVDC